MATPTTLVKAVGDKIPYTPSGAVVAGDVVALANGVGIVEGDLAASELGALVVEGLVLFPKSTGSASALATLGTKVYWDADNDVITTTAGSNKVAGYTAEEDDDGSKSTLLVKLARA